MAIRNFFNPNGSATDDITQLKSLVDASSTGDVDDVVQQQIINKYGSYDALYNAYEEEQNYQDLVSRTIAEGGGTGNDMMADFYANQTDALGQMQSMVDQSGTGGTVLQASTTDTNNQNQNEEEPEDNRNLREKITDSIVEIVGFPGRVAGNLRDTVSSPSKFTNFLLDPRTQAGLRMIQEGGTPSFSSPFARISKALIDTSTSLQAQAAAAASAKSGKVNARSQIYIPGQNPIVDTYLKSLPYELTEDGKGVKTTYYDYLTQQAALNNYSDITLEFDDQNNLVGVSNILKQHDMTKYKDEIFENYIVGTNTNIDSLLGDTNKKLVENNTTAGGTNKIIVETGPNGLYKVEAMELEGLTYTNQEFFAITGQNETLDKALEDAGYKFDEGTRIKVEGLVGNLNGKQVYGDLNAAEAPASTAGKQADDVQLDELPMQEVATTEVTEFLEKSKTSKEQSNILSAAVSGLGSLDQPLESLGIMETYFQNLANVSDSILGPNSPLNQKIQEVLQGGQDVYRKREEVQTLLNNLLLPKLKDLYPVSDKDIVFLGKSQPSLSSKSFFKTASFNQGVFAYDALIEQGVEAWNNAAIAAKKQPGFFYYPGGLEFNGKKYYKALDYAEAWAKNRTNELYAEALEDNNADIIEATKAFGYADGSDETMREVSKLAILDYAKTKKFREGKSDQFKEANSDYVKGIFQVGYTSGQDSDAYKNMVSVSDRIHRDRLQILYMIQALDKKDVDLTRINDQIKILVDQFEDSYGINFDSPTREGEFMISNVDSYIEGLGWATIGADKNNIMSYIYTNDLGLSLVGTQQ